MSEEENMITDIIKAIEGTKSTAELSFEDLSLKLPGMKLGVVITGKVSFTAKPIHERTSPGK